MGQLVSKLQERLEVAKGNVTEIIRGRKRKREEDDSSDDLNKALEKSLHTPKKKKLLTTTQYIYQALFMEQKNSDITVMALGKAWRLHKVYLCQSPYFSTMFNGSWKESCQDFIHIKILDPKITLESLNTVFGSFYLDEIVIEPLSVISVLATATIFQLDGIIEKCAEVMIETTNAETAIPYYEAGCQYGVQSVKESAFNWLLVNLLSFYNTHTKWLKLISCELMRDLVLSPDLYVLQTEFSVYTLIRLWMFLKFYPDYKLNDGTNSSNDADNNSNNVPSVPDDLTPQTYFAKRTDRTPFLHTSEGREFESLFRALRIQHLLKHHIDLKLVIEDNIIPKEWFNQHLLDHWNSILKIDHTAELGPGEVDDHVFFKHCIRYGRVLTESCYQKWRWTGFNLGLDLVLISSDTRVLNIRRHHKAEHERLLSLRTKRQFLIKVTMASLNEQRQITHSQTTGIKSITLERNGEAFLMLIDKELTYPMLISVNLLIESPDKKFLNHFFDPGEGTSTQIPISEIGANDESTRIFI